MIRDSYTAKNGFKYYINVDQSLKLIFSNLKNIKRKTEIVNIDESLNRIIASDIISEVNIPESNKSAMDGYAVHAEDTFGASQNNPLVLKEVGKIGIGKFPDFKLEIGQGAEVVTGSYLPQKSDAVVMVEYTKKIQPDLINIMKPVVPNQNIIKEGEDVKVNDVLVRKYTKIQPQDIGIMAAIGKSCVEVIKKPKVSVISSGDEIIEVGKEKEIAKIYDINRHLNISSIMEAGAEPLDYGIVRDDKYEIETKLKKAVNSSDIVIISAGTSVGKKDFVPEVINSLGKPGMIIHGVALKPGSPTGFAIIDNKPIISLPGFPVANAIAFRVFIKPIIEYYLGIKKENQPFIRARLTRRVASPGGMRTYVRVKIKRKKDILMAYPLVTAGSSLISSLAKADGLLIIPENIDGIEEMEEVDIILLRPMKVI